VVSRITRLPAALPAAGYRRADVGLADGTALAGAGTAVGATALAVAGAGVGVADGAALGATAPVGTAAGVAAGGIALAEAEDEAGVAAPLGPALVVAWLALAAP